MFIYKSKGAKQEGKIPLYRAKFADSATAERPYSFMLITKAKEEWVINALVREQGFEAAGCCIFIFFPFVLELFFCFLIIFIFSPHPNRTKPK